jgi:hypothetical protein
MPNNEIFVLYYGNNTKPINKLIATGYGLDGPGIEFR